MFQVINENKVTLHTLDLLRSDAVVECVSPDHVDRFCDRAADVILDEFVQIDPLTRAGIEIVINSRVALLTGEVTSGELTENNINEIAKNKLRSFLDSSGYNHIPIQSLLRYQDSELTNASSKGAGDQSVCVGYATDVTSKLISQESLVARTLIQKLWELSFSAPYIGKDGKVIVLNSDRGLSAYIRWQNDGSEIAKNMILNTATECNCSRIELNCGAAFLRGSVNVDTGVLGRKLVCDAYGASVPIGGGAISGKDASKVDRFGNYAARWAACELVRRFGGDAFVWLVYTLGVPEPVSAMFRCITSKNIIRGIIQPSEFSVDTVRNRFGLYRVCPNFFEQVATLGHFGWDYPWD